MGRAVLLLCSVLLCAGGVAESPAKSKSNLSYKLLSIHVKGLNHFKEDQVIAASGLKLGQYAGEAQFKEAAQRLGESGLFSNLSYKYQYSTAGCNLDLEVTETEKLVPILFDNFVWFSDDELLRMLRSRLPLFDAEVPAGGTLTDKVADALKEILSERKIFGDADYIAAAELNGPIHSYVYRVTLHPIVVRNMSFPGARDAEMSPLLAAAKPLTQQEYSRSKMRVQEQLNFLPVYLSRGYLKASFSDSQAKVAEDGPQTFVDVTFPVAPGEQYKLVKTEWSGNSVFPAQQLGALVHLKPGEPPNAVQLSSDLEEVQKLYGTKGYILANVEPVPTMDDAAATVNYELRVNESDQFRMGELTIDGIPEASAAKMAQQWQLKEGQPYDNSYLKRFFQIMYRDVGLKAPYNVSSKESVDREDKTVSIALHFVPK